MTIRNTIDSEDAGLSIRLSLTGDHSKGAGVGPERVAVTSHDLRIGNRFREGRCVDRSPRLAFSQTGTSHTGTTPHWHNATLAQRQMAGIPGLPA